MDNILLPTNIDFKEGAHSNQGIVEISPCYYGYGTTLGSALRRVLLSSLPGAAVIAIKIKGVQHEFSAIEHVQEDSLEVLLNFKKLRLRIFSDEPVRLLLKKKGKGDVTASDIKSDSMVEIVNPDLKLATITDGKGEFEVELVVKTGRGYVPSDEHSSGEKELGLMAVDAIYSPVTAVGYRVENVRVGEITDYDKLIMTIDTDGTFTPKQALEQAATILIDYFALLTGKKESDTKIEE